MAFTGSRRFELIRRLGQGGMGIVYEAYDREVDMQVALKTLHHLDPSSLYRFKREFRALADISHPNIVSLYELFSEGDEWFFTMELLEGVDLLRWVRPGTTSDAPTSRDQADAPTIETTSQDEDTEDGATLPPPSPSSTRSLASGVLDEARTRSAFGQLAEALATLHGASLVHRDVKPSNVLVTPRGRVVLMDFGVVAEGDDAFGSDALIAGTPAFMSPEQAVGSHLTDTADWYSFGVVLFLTLTGHLPFAGNRELIMMAKQEMVAPRARDLDASVPTDLDALCADLLMTRPEWRAGAERVFEVFEIEGIEGGNQTDSPTTAGGAFVGRQRELGLLHDAYEQVRFGAQVSAVVRGPSGMGKTTLVRRFLHVLDDHETSPFVLRGRCHERESLPYKAFDTVVDRLSQVLLSLDAGQVQQVLPADVDLLPRLFPVLRRVPGVQTAQPLGPTHPGELRQRAFESLRKLLARLGRLRPVVLSIDDLQWADRDSLELLSSLTTHGEPSRLLVLVSVREEDLLDGTSVTNAVHALGQGGTAHRVDVGPLNPDEQRELVERLAERSGGPALPERYWGDAEGSPLFLAELARFSHQRGLEVPAGDQLRLDDVLFTRVMDLPTSARSLLEMICVAGEPTPLHVLGVAAGLDPSATAKALGVLRVASLARVARRDQDPWVTTYHDRVRETVTAHITATLPEAHGRMASALERWESSTADALARHWLAAGDPGQAATYLVEAAESASSKLAFLRAADLYRAAIGCGGLPPARAHALRENTGRALALGGEHFEAASIFLEAAAEAESSERLTLLRHAADALLRCGRIERGLEVLAEVLDGLGVRLAKTRRGALFSLVLQRARIALRGTRFKAVPDDQISLHDMGRLDTLYAAATSLGMIDNIRGAELQARHLLAALSLGEERRVHRALAIDAVFLSTLGRRNLKKAAALSQRVELKARQLDDPYLLMVAYMARGSTAFFGGRSTAAADDFKEAESIAANRVVGADWERVTNQFFYLQARINVGAYAEVAEAAGRFSDEAARRQDVYAANLFDTQPNTWRLLRQDDPEAALMQLESATDGWPASGELAAHQLQATAQSIALLYAGRAAEALAILRAREPVLRATMVDRVPWVMAEYWLYRGRAALVEREYVDVKRAIRFVRKLDIPIGRGIAASFEAALASHEAQRDRVQALLLESLTHFAEAKTPQYLAGSRYRLALSTGGDEGQRLMVQARETMTEQGIVNPCACCACSAWASRRAPGPPSRRARRAPEPS